MATRGWKFWLVLVAAVLLLLWWIRGKMASTSTLKPDVSGYPTTERASEHFTWDELLASSGDTYTDLDQSDKDVIVAIARLLERIRTANGDLGIHAVISVRDPAGGYVVNLSPLPGETWAGLQQAALDVTGPLAAGSTHAANGTTGGTPVQVFGSSAALVGSMAGA